MNSLSHREHARLARELIDACGGLDEAARNCRVSKSVLSSYQNPHETSTMPADVMHALETFCGRPIYASALFECFGAQVVTGNLRDASCNLSEEALELQATVRRALADDTLTPRELDEIAKAEREAEAALETVRGVRRAAESGVISPHPKRA